MRRLLVRTDVGTMSRKAQVLDAEGDEADDRPCRLRDTAWTWRWSDASARTPRGSRSQAPLRARGSTSAASAFATTSPRASRMSPWTRTARTRSSWSPAPTACSGPPTSGAKWPGSRRPTWSGPARDPGRRRHDGRRRHGSARGAESGSGTVVTRAAPTRRRTRPERSRARRPDRRRCAIDGGGDRRARPLLADGRTVVVTMGESGALVIENERTTHVPAPRVDAVETTGAGDAFWGSPAAGLAAGHTLVGAARDAVRVALQSTLRRGALEALPAAGEIKSLLAAASSAA